MSENFEDLFKQTDIRRQKLNPGQKVEATVTGISKEYVFLDIGSKGEGSIELKEFVGADGIPTVSEGDRLTVYFLGSANQEMQFTTKIGSGSGSEQLLAAAFHGSIPVEGTVVKEIKGGFEVTVAGTRAFCPYSQIDLRRAEDAESYIGQRYLFKITEYDAQKRNLLVSRRAMLEEHRAEQKENLRATLKEGDQVAGTITSIRDFGLFVDIGGTDGLIPLSEIGWNRTDDIQGSFTVGEQVEVTVIKLDWENDRITLSIKAAQPDPWDKIDDFAPGSLHRGIVARLMEFGAFVTLRPGIDGLIHISKLGKGKRIHHPREVLEPGQEVEVTIEGVDRDKKRISLNLPGVSEEREEGEQSEAEVREFLEKPAAGSQKMGTLGDLLQAQMKEKKKK